MWLCTKCLFSTITTEINKVFPRIGDPKIFSNPYFTAPDGIEDRSIVTLDILILVVWVICWLATSNWPWRKSMTWDKLK
jgi:hypothetical protein